MRSFSLLLLLVPGAVGFTSTPFGARKIQSTPRSVSFSTENDAALPVEEGVDDEGARRIERERFTLFVGNLPFGTFDEGRSSQYHPPMRQLTASYTQTSLARTWKSCAHPSERWI